MDVVLNGSEKNKLLPGNQPGYKTQKNTENEPQYFAVQVETAERLKNDSVLFKLNVSEVDQAFEEVQNLILKHMGTLATEENQINFIKNILHNIACYRDEAKTFIVDTQYIDITICLDNINKNAPNLMIKLKKWINLITRVITTNVDNDYWLVQFKVNFFNKLDALAKPADYKNQAANIINAIISNTIDELGTYLPNVSGGRVTNNKDREFNNQIKIICESPNHREELLTWLFLIKNSNDGGIYFALGLKALNQAQMHIKTTVKSLNKSELYTFIEGVIQTINSCRGLSAIDSSTRYRDIKEQVSQIFLFSPHLLVELELWIMFNYYNDSYNVIKPELIPEQVKQQEQNHINFIQARNLIYNLYHNSLYCSVFIQLILEISGDNHKAMATRRLTEVVQVDLRANRAIENKKIEYEADYIMGKEKYIRILGDNPHPEILEKLNDTIGVLSSINSAQREKLKIWVKNGLKDGKPEKTKDIEKIIDFFQNHLFQIIIYFSNEITLSDIGKLQGFKLGKAGSPDEKIAVGLYNTFKDLVRIFNTDSFQNLAKRMLKTIYAVIDSEQYKANTGYATSYFNLDHTKIDMTVNNGYDPFLYEALTKNIEIMASIRNICLHPRGDTQVFSKLVGDALGANYTTSEVDVAKEYLSSMITKEFYGAGYNALKVASISFKHYLKNDSNTEVGVVTMDTSTISNSESHVLTDDSEWVGTTPTQQRKEYYKKESGEGYYKIQEINVEASEDD